MRLTILYQRTTVHDDDLVEVKDGIELVRDSDYRVRCELLAQESLDQ